MNDVSAWSVEFSSKLDRKWHYNGMATVIAPSAQMAMDVVLTEVPDAQIHAIHKRSRGPMWVHPSVMVATPEVSET